MSLCQNCEMGNHGRCPRQLNCECPQCWKPGWKGLKAGEYRYVGTPLRIAKEFPDTISVRTFATPSHTMPGRAYYLQAVKGKKAGWGNGTAIIMCNCVDALLKFGCVLSGTKAPCKHAKGLRALLRKRSF